VNDVKYFKNYITLFPFVLYIFASNYASKYLVMIETGIINTGLSVRNLTKRTDCKTYIQ